MNHEFLVLSPFAFCTLLNWPFQTLMWFAEANARLRIVSERVDFINNLIISVTVIIINLVSPYIYIYLAYDDIWHASWPDIFIQIGPPNPEFLKSKDTSTWTAKDVADSVLSDKSALVIVPFLCLSWLVPGCGFSFAYT